MFEYGGGFVQDRSVYEDVDIFAKMHEEQGTMSPEDFHTYSELFNAMVMTPYFPKPDVLIYLECDYDEVIDRIKQRGRDMEINTDPEYWKNYSNVTMIGLIILMLVQWCASILMSMIFTKIWIH